MILGYPAEAIRKAEKPLLDAGVPLMRDAAMALAVTAMREIRRLGQRVSGSVAVSLVGGGNNGGDALWAAVELSRRGVQAWAALCSPRVHTEGLAAARAAGVRIVEIVPGDRGDAIGAEERSGADRDPGTAVLPAAPDIEVLLDVARRAGVWLDGLAGIGLRGPLREPLAQIVEALNTERDASPDEPVVIGIDVPSGMGDSGVASETVLKAHITVTMGAAKPGLLLPPASRVAGRVEVVELGLPLDPRDATVARWDAPDVADLYPWPSAADHKYTRGVVGIEAGSRAYPGAGYLACRGALAVGAGMVRYLGELTEIPHTVPEVVTQPGRVQALVVGSGDSGALVLNGATPEARAVPLILDAGALRLLKTRGDMRDRPGGVVATPHAGELADLLDIRRHEVEADPATAARRAARELGAVVLLKGATTVVATPERGPVIAVNSGTPWLATAGTGDVLAGVAGALVAMCQARAEAEGRALSARELAEASASAAWLHGAAACEIGGPLRASRLGDALARVIRRLVGAKCASRGSMARVSLQ